MRLGEDYHIDHIVPICSGGTNDPSNIQLACPACNRAKGGQDPVDFARGVLGLLL
jgi:5-methylcytosine-specific restriction endonuclease McrA